MKFDFYINMETNEILTREQFERLALDYIEEGKREGRWEEGEAPTKSEVMLNMDEIQTYRPADSE